MSSWELGFDLVATFLLAAGLLFYYGNWYHHKILVTLSVLIAWYFSFIIIFVLPIDISNTTYRKCVAEEQKANSNTNTTTNTTTVAPYPSNCTEPSSYVGEDVLSNLWRIVYWSSQALTWLLLPMLQSYTKAGEFNFKGKLKSALLDNAIYYGIYLFICAILLIYLATRPNTMQWPQLKAIASSASNSWGLFLLVFMLGYGLVSVPLTLWNASCKGHSLNSAYFKMAKLNHERSQSEEELTDALESLSAALKSTSTTAALKPWLSQIENLLPTEHLEKLRRLRTTDTVIVDEKYLIKLHRQIKKSLQTFNRVERQWEDQVEATIWLEDVEKSSGEKLFRRSLEREKSFLEQMLCGPRMEQKFYCLLLPYILKMVSIITAILSLLVIWSESTFPIHSPILTVFALILSKIHYDYSLIEFFTTLTIAYMACCAFYTVFKIRFFNFYYLAGKQHTDEYSLVFSGMLLCRLTPPLCLNVLTLFQLDSHVVKQIAEETSYTKVMGHMDVLSLISDGFNIYFPLGILIVALLTYFKVGSRLLNFVGIQQFLVDEEITSELVQEGGVIIQREKRRRQRNLQAKERVYRSPEANENLRVVEPNQDSFYGGTTRQLPPRDLFDDV